MARSLALISAAAAAALARAEPASLSCGAGLCFASGIGSSMVLQQAPARAAVYGSVPAGSPAGASVVVSINATDGSFSKTYAAAANADGSWKVVLGDARPGGAATYSLAASCANCAGSAGDRVTPTLTDVVFGDVFFCSGQSNMWLPLWFTFERNETTRNVALGRYDNLRLWRGGLGKLGPPTGGSGNWVAPAGPEPPGGDDGNDALTNQWRHPKDLLPPNFIRDGEPWLWEFPSTCFYAASYLTDMMVAAGMTPPPMGLMTVPVGGTMLEEWSSPETQAKVKNVTCMCTDSGCDSYQPLGPNCVGNSAMWYGNTQPFVNLTIKMHLYYQGENNLQFDGGNSAQNTGYAALFPQMIADWRAIWSAVPGTTDPLAPFGFVTLADGTDEAWGLSMAGLRWAQFGSYATVPNALMPNTFAALGHDAGDPWDDDSCGDRACCVDPYIPLGSTCEGDHRGQWSVNGTGWFEGQVHRMYPRQNPAHRP